MTTEDQILEELRQNTKHQRVIIGLLWDIKYELQNARKIQEAAGISYKIKVRKPWLDRIKEILKKF